MIPAPEALLGWLGEASLALAAAIVLVLALGPVLRRWAGPGAALGLWALPLAALLAVSLPARSVREAPAAAAAMPALAPAAWLDAPIDMASSRVASIDAAPADAPVLAASSALRERLATLLAAAWLAGAALTALALWRQQRRFLRALGPLKPCPDGTWRAATSHLGPLALGALRPRIVLPADFERRYSPRQQALMLAHERVHVARGDLLANFAACVARVAFWFHPLVHVAAERLRHDQELACDAAVLRLNPDARRAYADAVLDTQLAVLGLPVGCRWQSSHPLHRRLIMLKHPSPGRLRARLGTGLALALTAGAAGAAWAAQPARVVVDEAAPAAAPVAPPALMTAVATEAPPAPPAVDAPPPPPPPPAPSVAAVLALLPEPPAPPAPPEPPAPPAPSPPAIDRAQPAPPSPPAPEAPEAQARTSPVEPTWFRAPRYAVADC